VNKSSRLSKRSLALCAGLLFALSGCGKDDDSPSASAGSGGLGSTGGTTGTSGAAGSGGSQAVGGTGSAPDGFTLTPGLDLSNDPGKCDGVSSISCSGHCVTKTEETTGCQALATARIFSEVARDDNGIFFSEQRSSSSSLWSVDPASGTLVQLAEPPGDNMHLRLALGDEVLYFVSNRTLYSVPRTGGEPTELLPELPNTNLFEVVDQRLFAKISLDPEVHELDLAGGAPLVHNLDPTSFARDGNDLYYAESDSLYQSAGADLSAVTALGAPATKILGITGDRLYALGGTGEERAVHRFSKTGNDGEVVFVLGSTGLAALASDAVAFTRQDGSRHYICTVDLEGNAPTIHGYLPDAPALLAADETFVYATMGFNLIRIRR
jgi:hypothetical protein